MQGDVARVAYRLVLAGAFMLLLAGSVQPQSIGAVSSRWVWKEIAGRDKPQTQFSIMIRREGNVASGVYSVDEFINGKWQGEDGNQTAFLGRINGKTLHIKFDPRATVPGYEENVNYRAPFDGRQPSIAVLNLRGSTLLWRLASGARIEGVPDRLTLHRERRPK